MAEPSTPSEGAPEEIPEEIPPEPAGKKRAWWKIVAVIIVIVVIISVIAVVYLLPQQGPAANGAPSITQTAASTEYPNVNSPVTFTAQATDPDNDALTYIWNFGDGNTASGNFSSGQASVSHSFTLSGNFIGLLTVGDGHNHNVTNDGKLLFVQAKLSASSIAQPADCTTGTCAVGPVVPVLSASASTTQVNTQITFNANSSWAYDFAWTNASNHAEGGSYSVVAAGDSPSLFTSFTYDWGDGSAATTGTSTAVGEAAHTFTATGLYFVKLTVVYTRSDLSGSPVTMSTGYSVRVLATAPTTQVKYPDIFTEVTIGEPQYLDPGVDYETAGGEVLQSAYESLVWYQEGSQSLTTILPRLATSVPTTGNGITADGKNYTFNLRQNVTFHDGSHMTADDVAFSFVRAMVIHDPDGPSWMIDQVLNNYVYYYVGAQCGPSSAPVQCYVSDWVGDMFPSAADVPPNIMNVVGAESTWATEPVTVSLAWAVMNSSVEKNSDYQVTFHLTHAYPGFMSVLAFTVGDVVSKSCVNANGGLQWETHNAKLDRGTDCGTGPYYIDSWVPNQVIILKRFDNYWRTPAPIKEVHIAKANDIATRELMLFSGDADTAAIGWIYSRDVLATDGNTPKYNYLSVTKGLPSLNVDFLGYNQNINTSAVPDPWTMGKDFFGNTTLASDGLSIGLHVRRAFSYVFDYDTYINTVLYGGALHLNGAIPQGLLGYNANIPGFTYNLDAAKAELDKTPWPTKGITLTLYYNAGNDARATAALLFKAGLEALWTHAGYTSTLTVDVRALDWPVYLFTLQHKGLPIFFLGWAPDYADPDDYVTPFLHTGNTYPNRVGYSNTTLDALIDQAAATLDQNTRAQMYQTITYDSSVYDVPYLWTAQATSFHVERTWVHGWFYNAMLSGIYFYGISKS